VRPLPRAALRSPELLAEGVYALVAESGMPALAVSVGTPSAPAAVVWANDGALALLGLTSDEVVGIDLVALASEDLDPHVHWTTVVTDAIAARPATTTIQDPSAGDEWVDAAIEGPGRSVWPVQMQIRLPGDELAVILLRSASQEVRMAETAQRESEHRLRALAEHAPVGIVVSELGSFR
jgi:PAS domain-containing protein